MIEDKAALKMATDLVDCANAYVMLAKNSSMTGQKIQVGKYSSLLSTCSRKEADLDRRWTSDPVSLVAREVWPAC